MAETKYEELWRIYNEERKQHVDYKNSCLDFTDKFFEAFARYIGGPRERLRFSPLNDMGDWNPTPHGTMRVEDDGRLSTCMMLELGPAPDPKVTRLGMSELQIPVYVSKDTTGFRIQVGDTPTRSFTSAEDAARQSFFDVICERFKRHLHESLTLEVVPKQIGFHRD